MSGRVIIPILVLISMVICNEPLAQTNCACDETCAVLGNPVVATAPLATRPGGTGYKSWASTTISVRADNNPPDFINSTALRAMLNNAKDAWDNNTCLNMTSGTNITFYYVHTKEEWDSYLKPRYSIAEPNIFHVDSYGNIDDVQILVNFGYFEDDQWNDDGEPTSGYLGDSPIDGRALFIHEIGHALGLWVTEIGGNYQPQTWADTVCTTVVGWYNVFGGPKPLDIAAIACAYNCAENFVIDGPPFLSAVTADSCDYDPIASVVYFSVDDEGVARWITTSESRTSYYEIVGHSTRSGHSGNVVGSCGAGIGNHVISLSSGDFPFYSLVEIDYQGKRTQVALYNSDRDMGRQRNVELQDIGNRAAGNANSQVQRDFTAPTAFSSSGPPTFVIFSVEPLIDVVTTEIASFWEQRGQVVEVVNASDYDYESRSDSIDAAIADYFTNYGTKYFTLVGDSYNNMLSSFYWEVDDYWRQMKEDVSKVIAAGEGDVIINTDYVIPSFEKPDYRKFVGGVLNVAPVIYSDHDYADVDGDSKPDVVVTRLFRNLYQTHEDTILVAKYAQKMRQHVTTPRWTTHNVLTVAHDLDSPMGGVGSGTVVAERMLNLTNWINNLDSTANIRRFNSSVFPNVQTRSDTLATWLNQLKPELMIHLSTDEAFYDIAVAPPYPDTWVEENLEAGVIIPLWVAASCSGASGGLTVTGLRSTEGRGAVGTVGPAYGSLSIANYVFSALLLEELYADPWRSMAESWLRAIQRAYDLFEYSPNELAAIMEYHFTGDPLAPFRAVPEANIASFARRRRPVEEDTLVAMPEHYAIGCPQGDEDTIVVFVEIAEDDVEPPIPIEAITISQPIDTNIAFYGSLVADSVPTLSEGFYHTTITIEQFSGCGIDSSVVDSAMVKLYDFDLGYARIHIKSPDYEHNQRPDGLVDLMDLTEFGFHHPSTICNCIYPQPYSSCVDYVFDTSSVYPDTSVDNLDFTLWGMHYLHEIGIGGGSSALGGKIAYSTGTVELKFTEDYPLQGNRTLKTSVVLSNAEPFKSAFLSFKNENPTFKFKRWEQDPDFPGRTMCVDIVRNGQREIVLGVIGTEEKGGELTTLGYFESDVNSTEQLALSEDDFELVVADLLESGGSVLTFRGSQTARTVEPTVFRNQLAQNYPNPFNPTTTIAFSLKNDADVSLKVYDVRGALVKTLIDDHRQRNNYKVVWEGKNNKGQSVASGIYFYRLDAGDFTATKKMVLLR